MAKSTDGDGSGVHARRLNLPRIAEPQVTIDGPAMPGEAVPLSYEPGRGPLTRDEVLANYRRRQRIRNDRLPPDKHEQLAEQLPDAQGPKDPVNVRMSTLVVEYLNLYALLEDLPVTAVLEAAVMEMVLRSPQRPDKAKVRYFELQEALNNGKALVEAPASPSPLDLVRLRQQAAELTAAIDDLEGGARAS
ncbi:hypothetical protein AB0B66_10765 [Catellatospora sp. NPDC049111]|uniref:hypothetical protein n=1 Tax=Catellatospora sp. NPDC049111 TaxID=3155271 RepID=UPI0033FE78B6